MGRVVTAYQHVQTTPSATWTIVHGLGDYPIVDVYVQNAGSFEKIIPLAITYVDPNTCTVSFSIPISGKATVT